MVRRLIQVGWHSGVGGRAGGQAAPVALLLAPPHTHVLISQQNHTTNANARPAATL